MLSLVTAPTDVLALIQLSVSIPIQLLTVLVAASAWRLRLEPRIELLRDLRNGVTVVSLLNTLHWFVCLCVPWVGRADSDSWRLRGGGH